MKAAMEKGRLSEDRAYAACARQSSRADAGRRKRGIETVVNACFR
jgi:hypothetical protein